MVLNLTLLGLVWLVGLIAVHRVAPVPPRRCQHTMAGHHGALHQLSHQASGAHSGRPHLCAVQVPASSELTEVPAA